MEDRLIIIVLLLSSNVFAQVINQPQQVFQTNPPMQTFQAQGVPFQGAQASPNQISYTPFQTVPFPSTFNNVQQQSQVATQPQLSLGGQLQPLDQLTGNNLLQQNNPQQIQIQGTTFQAAPGTSLQPFVSAQPTPPSTIDSNVQNTIQSTVKEAQKITQNAANQNSGTDSSVVSKDTSLNGSIIRYNGKVFIAELNGQMIEAPSLAHLIGRQIVNGEIVTQDDSSMAGVPQNNIAAPNGLMPPAVPPMNGQNPMNNMIFPNQAFLPPGQVPMQQQLPFPGQMRPNLMQNMLFPNRQFMLQNRQMPVQQNMIGQFSMRRPPMPFQQNPMLQRPPFMRPPMPFPGQPGGFRQGPPMRRFGEYSII